MNKRLLFSCFVGTSGELFQRKALYKYLLLLLETIMLGYMHFMEMKVNNVGVIGQKYETFVIKYLRNWYLLIYIIFCL